MAAGNLFEVFLKNADFLKIYTDYVSKVMTLYQYPLRRKPC